MCKNLFVLLVLFAALLVACKEQGKAPPVQKEQARLDETSATAEPAPQPGHGESVARLAMLLPQHTLALATVGGLQGALDTLGQREIMKAFAAEIETVRPELEAVFGFDPLAGEALGEAGIALDGLVGVAYLDEDQGWSAIVIEVAQPTRFQRFFQGVVERHRLPMLQHEMEDGTVFWAYEHDPRNGVLLRQGFAFLVEGSAAGWDGSELTIKALAHLDPQESLGMQRAFVHHLEKLGADAGGLVYLNGPGLFGERRDYAPGPVLSARVQEAKIAGDGPSLDFWLKVMEEERSRHGYAEHIRERFLAPLGPFMGALKLTDAVLGFEAQSHALLPDAFLIKALPQTTEVPRIVHALPGEPLFLLSLNLAPEHLVELLKPLLAYVGFENLGHFAQVLLEQDLLPFLQDNLAGQIGLALTGEFNPAADGGLGALGLDVYVALRAPEAAREYLGRLAQLPELGWHMAPTQEGFVIKNPGWHDIQVGLTPTGLWLSTDSAFPQRMAKGGGLGEQKESRLRERLMTPSSVVVAVDQATLGYWFVRTGPMPAELAGAKPTDPELAATYEQYLAVTKELETLHQEIEAGEVLGWLKAFGALGTSVFILRAEAEGMAVEVAQVVRAATVGDALIRIGRLALGSPERDAAQEKLANLRARQRELAQKLWGAAGGL